RAPEETTPWTLDLGIIAGSPPRGLRSPSEACDDEDRDGFGNVARQGPSPGGSARGRHPASAGGALQAGDATAPRGSTSVLLRGLRPWRTRRMVRRRAGSAGRGGYHAPLHGRNPVPCRPV